jgi:hypothetical protein
VDYSSAKSTAFDVRLCDLCVIALQESLIDSFKLYGLQKCQFYNKLDLQMTYSSKNFTIIYNDFSYYTFYK